MNVLDILGSMFAPDIIGNNIIKQGMLLCAASTNKDESQKKIHVLIIGDPGLGKSAVLRKSMELFPIADMKVQRILLAKVLRPLLKKMTNHIF